MIKNIIATMVAGVIVSATPAFAAPITLGAYETTVVNGEVMVSDVTRYCRMGIGKPGAQTRDDFTAVSRLGDLSLPVNVDVVPGDLVGFSCWMPLLDFTNAIMPYTVFTVTETELRQGYLSYTFQR